MLRLTCGYQSYEWGKKGAASAVAQVVGESDATKPYAELWIGAHPSKPSIVHTPEGSAVALADYVKAHASTSIGRQHAATFGDTVPFLLKILSIGKALSIQAHPDKVRAARLHGLDPKNYPDPNHKPELIVALTPLQALCCFRPLSEVRHFLTSVRGLSALTGSAAEEGASERDVLRPLLERLYSAPQDVVAAAIGERLAQLASMPSAELPLEDRVFRRLATEEFPGDVGCWMVYFLNVVEVPPGDGLFLSQNEPHAYLQGDGVEIMASSDNVVRAGLTPKFKDVPTLLEMLTYRTDVLANARHHNNQQSLQFYSAPSWCQDFSLVRVTLESNSSVSVPPPPSLALGVVISGSGTATVGDNAAFPLSRGATFYLPATSLPFEVRSGSDGLHVFFASIAGWEPQQPARL